MNLISFIRLLNYHYKLLILSPLLVMITVLGFMKDEERNYLTTTTLYTGFASGYKIENRKIDYYDIQIKFDNFFESIKSRTTREDIILKTLAFYLAQDKILKKDMSINNQIKFNELIPNKLKNNLVVINNEVKTYKNLNRYYRNNFDNEIYYLLNSSYSPLRNFFGLDQLLSLEGIQEGASDRSLISYKATDPGICYHTSRIAIEVIMEKVKTIKSAESDDVIDYFLEESKRAHFKLEQAESELTSLMNENNIINYYEQTKFIASRKEDFNVAYQSEKLKLSASKATVLESEKKMNIGLGIKLKNDRIYQLMKDLRIISNKVAMIEMQIFNYADTIGENLKYDELQILEKELVQYEKEVSVFKENLQKEVEKLYKMKHTTVGIKTDGIATSWLESVMEVEKYTARINLYKKFKEEFEITYSKFAKLGSSIKRMERKISILEKDYLDLLASVNHAKLIKKNISMSTNLKVVDPPFYPVNPEKSKKMLYTIGGGLSGFIIILSLLIFLENFDNSIKTPERAREFTNLSIIGGLPLLITKEIAQFGTLHDRLINQISTYINFMYFTDENKSKPFVVLFMSTRQGEGKSQLSQLIARDMRISGEPTLVASPKSDKEETHLISHSDKDNILYDLPKDICDIELDNKEIIGDKNIEDYRFIFLEIPAIIGSDLPIQILRKANLSLLILKSNRIWNRADNMGLDTYSKIINHPISSILNGSHPDNLETIIGEIPKKRSWLRKKIKRVAKFQFKSKHF